MKAHWSFKFAAPFLVTGLLVASCGDDDSNDATGSVTSATTASSAGGGTTAATSATEASGRECTNERRGGTLTVGDISGPPGLDPARLSGGGTVGADEVVAFYDVLMRYDDEAGKYVPHVAESLSSNSDYTQWTLKLRPAVRFGNGDPLTAESVRTSIERMRDPAIQSPLGSFLATIKQMQVVDGRTLQFTLDDPWPDFAHILAEPPGMIVNTAIVNPMGKDAFGANPQGAGVGPFEVERYAPGEEIVFKPKADYWGGLVCLDRLRFVPLPNGTTNYEAFQRGEINVGIVTNSRTVAEIEGDGVDTYPYVQSIGQSLLVNSGYRGGTPPTSDVRVRQAIAHAIDVKAINDRIYDGTAIGTSAVIAPGSQYFEDLEGPAYDPAKARALVDEVKRDKGWDGSIDLACFANSSDLAVLIEGMLEAVGFKVNSEPAMSVPDLLGRIFGTGNYQLACWGLAMTDLEIWPRLYQNLVSTSSGNVSGYADPDMDAAIGELKHATNSDEIKAALAKIQELWTERVPMVVLNGNKVIFYWGDDVHGLRFHHRVIALFDDVYLDT